MLHRHDLPTWSTLSATLSLIGSLGTAQVPVQQVRFQSLGFETNFQTEPLAGGRTRVIYTRHASRSTLDLPVRTVTHCLANSSSLLLSCEENSGRGILIRLTLDDGVLSSSASASTGERVPIKIATGGEFLGMLTSQGEIWVARDPGGTDLPDAEDWQRVASSVDVGIRIDRRTALGISADGRFVVQNDRIQRVFFQQDGGIWRRIDGPVATSPPRALIRMEQPVALNRSIRFWTNRAGPVFLESESSGILGTAIEDCSAGQWHELSAGFGAMLRPGQRYRLLGHEVASEWFSPALITGETVNVGGAFVSDIRGPGTWAIVERGLLTFRATITLPAANPISTLKTLGLVTWSDRAVPDVIEIGQHRWLHAASALLLEQGAGPGRRTYSLAIPVPTIRHPAAVSSWVHGQILALDQDGQLLGATAIRSIPLRSEPGRVGAAHEEQVRAQASALWGRYGVDPNRLLEAIARRH